ncbi:MAG: hypothetical protein E5X60_19600, partial [Mesorhizobium sp.]
MREESRQWSCQSPPKWGRCPAGQRGAPRNASLAILFIVLSLLFLPLTTLAAELPALTGRVVDNAG